MGKKKRGVAATTPQETNMNTEIKCPGDGCPGCPGCQSDEQSGPAETPVLLGSERSYAYVQIGDGEATLLAIVAVAQQASGLTPEQWNALGAEERDAWIDSRIDNERALVAAGQSANVPILPIPPLETGVGVQQPVNLSVDVATGADTTAQGIVTASAVTAERTVVHVQLDDNDPTPAKTIETVVDQLTQEKLPMADHDQTPTAPEGLGTMAGSVIAAVIAYIPAMRPKMPVLEADRHRQQIALYRAITALINRVEGEEFTRCYTWLLQQFSLYRQGVFAERYVFRDFETVGLSEDERNAFRRLLTLLSMTCDPKAWPLAFKQLDMNKTLAVGINEAGRQRVLAYYGL